MDNYKYISENTIQHISLHDCCCSIMYWDRANLIFEMEWMEVLASHPDNPFEKAHQSGTGAIVIYDPVIESGELTNGSNSIPIIELNEVKDFEILIFDENIYNVRFELSVFGDSVCDPKAEFIEMKINYSSSKVMFNELGDVSWFDSEEFLNSGT